MAVVYSDKGENDKALEYYQRSLSTSLDIFGDGNSGVANIYNNDKGEFDESVEYTTINLSLSD